MTVLQAIALGIVQGITEFLPISSSGHLLLLPKFFDWNQQGLDFDVAVHVATLAAIIVALRKDVMRLFQVPKLFWLIVYGTLPVVLFGLLLEGGLLDALRQPLFVALSLTVWGIALIVANGIAKHHEKLPALHRVGWRRSLLIGFAQVIALIPGTSRSGITMTSGMLLGLNREDAARFSFLLAVPAIAGAGLLTFKDALEVGLSVDVGVLTAGMISAFISGLLAIQLLLVVARRVGFMWFGVYRIALAILVLLLLV